MKTIFDTLQKLKFRLGLDRKNFILRYIKSNKCTQILEIGVFNGNFAERMLKVASKNSPNAKVHYIGVDLFADGLTQEKYITEVSLYPKSLEEVQSRLQQSSGAKIELLRGDSVVTVPMISKKIKFDLIHIDGGHSFATVHKDWHNVINLMDSSTAVFFDDYSNSRGVSKGGFGIKTVIDGLDPGRFKVKLSKNRDFFWKSYGLLSLRIAMVKLKKAIL